MTTTTTTIMAAHPQKRHSSYTQNQQMDPWQDLVAFTYNNNNYQAHRSTLSFSNASNHYSKRTSPPHSIHRSNSTTSNTSTISSCSTFVSTSTTTNSTINGSSSSGSSHTRGSSHANGNLYKTEFCTKFRESGSCPFGDKCQFVHHDTELQRRSRALTYKTRHCWSGSDCAYQRNHGRCIYLHGNETAEMFDQQRGVSFAKTSNKGRNMSSYYEEIEGEESPRWSGPVPEPQESQHRSIFRRTSSNSSPMIESVSAMNSAVAASTASTPISNSDRSYSIASDHSTSCSAPLLYNPIDYINQHQEQPFDFQPSSSGSTTAMKDGRQQRRKTLLHHQHPQPVQIRLWRLLWFVTLVLGEHGFYWVMIDRCSWPENQSWDASESSLKDRYRIVIIADPQLTDWFSYKQSGIGLWLTEFYTDLFMRRSFRRLHAKFQPDAVLYLGDLLDGGRETMDRERFDRNRDRFLERVFDTTRSGWNLQPVVMDQEDRRQGSKDGDNDNDNNTDEKEGEWEWKENEKRLCDESEKDLQTGAEGGSSGERENNVEDTPNGMQGDTNLVADNSNKNNNSDARASRGREKEINISGRYSQLLQVPLNADERSLIRSEGKSVRLYVAGNHDYGFGNTIIRQAVKRYKREFGSVNYEIQVGNHTIVVLDTLALSSNITSIRDEAQEFLTRIAKEEPTSPRILFTHVPLFRMDSTFCGERREADNSIVDDYGEQYQNLVNSTLTKDVLRSIRPDVVFSGDDHDWCEIAHDLDQRLTPEVTLPTFSFAQGIKQPGFVLLTLYNPEEITKNLAPMVSDPDKGHGAAGSPSADRRMDVATVSDRTTFAYDECLLPKQLSIYDFYTALFLLTAGWLMILRMRWMRHLRRSSADPVLIQWRQQPVGSPLAGSKDDDGGPKEEEDDDEPCDEDSTVPMVLDQATQGTTTATRLSPLQEPQWSRKQYPLTSEQGFSELCHAENSNQEKYKTTFKTTIPFSPSLRRSLSPHSPISPISPLVGNHNTGGKKKRRGGPSGYSVIKGVRQGDLEMVVGWCRDRILRPVGSRLFWRMVLWDLWSIFRYVLPFYAVLLIVSLT
ncbi:ethanolamine phosphate phosphodiesterase [Entomortierella parvispora]|uniref:Ethanolamine phosphate phosphodiesterase n=1 Tax=Entomortierella parvispora TaxID=205924 RepID=A0A9P3H5E2_9FUNG|nr:ethanolamine phosphate phosphodiesterase [Entomortierella parvispora]